MYFKNYCECSKSNCKCLLKKTKPHQHQGYQSGGIFIPRNIVISFVIIFVQLFARGSAFSAYKKNICEFKNEKQTCNNVRQIKN